MSQYEQENDLGAGGGEVDDETRAEAWRRSEEVHNAPVDAESGMTRDPEAGDGAEADDDAAA